MWLYSIQQLRGCDNTTFAFAKVKWKSEDKKEYFDFPNIVIMLSRALSLVCPFCHLLKDNERQERFFYKFVVLSSACYVGVCWGNCVGAGDTNRWIIWSRKLALWLATNWTYLKICGGHWKKEIPIYNTDHIVHRLLDWQRRTFSDRLFQLYCHNSVKHLLTFEIFFCFYFFFFLVLLMLLLLNYINCCSKNIP